MVRVRAMETRRTELGAFLMLAGFVGFSSAQEVRVPAGPLYRVVGTHISIVCNVSGSEGSGLQDFEWSVQRPEASTVQARVISSSEPNFSSAPYAPRVRSGDIYVQRLSADSAELHLTQVWREDEGEYECYVPSIRKRYLGIYSAKVHLKVLPDTLKVGSPSGSPSHLTAHDGESLTLPCRAAALSTLHTHLSVSFSLSRARSGSRGGGHEAVIGVGRDFTVETAGAGSYRSRYERGEIEMDKVAGGSYRLRIERLRLEDAGSYSCTAAEWIQDPDGEWRKIVERTAPLANLTVQPIDVTLGVTASIAPSMFYRGDTVVLHCNASLSGGEEVKLAVSWWAEQEHALAQVDRDGVSQRGAERESGKVSTDRATAHCFRLWVHTAGKEDEGRYRCEVAVWARGPGGHWYQAVEARSETVTLFLYLTASDTLLVPMAIGVASSILLSIGIISTVTCCFLRRLAKK